MSAPINQASGLNLLPTGEKKVHPLLWIFRSPDLRRALPLLGFTSLLANLLALVVPMAMLQIMDRIVSNRSVETLILLIIGIVIAVIFEEILRSINGMVTGWLGARFEHYAGITALQRLMHVPISRFQKEDPVAYADRIIAAARVAEFYSGHALLVIFDFPFVFIFLGLVGYIGGWLVIVPAILLLFFTLLIMHFGGWMGRQVEERSVLDQRRYNFLVEVLSRMTLVKALAMESLMLRRYELLQNSNAQLAERLAHAGTITSGAGVLFSQVMMVSTVFLGSILVIYEQITPGALAACMMLSVRALQPLRRSLAVWLRYQGFHTSRQNLAEVLEMPTEDESGKPDLQEIRTGLELRDIQLAYAQDAPLFDGINLTIPVGKCFAIQGQSGSGKSSLLSMLNGLVRPDRGQVLVDGQALSGYSAESVRKKIILLSQNGTLFTGTILENMTMFQSALNPLALEIAEKLGLDQIVSGMRLGYETMLGEGVSDTMPEGVKQQINIIRNLVLQPEVILFDEANISLDMRGDKMLRDYLAELKGRCTLVLVTHRPSLLSLADEVYSLQFSKLTPGRVFYQQLESMRQGVDETIPERPPHLVEFRKMVSSQFSEDTDLSRCVDPMLKALKWEGHSAELVEAMPHMLPQLDITGFCTTFANLGYLTRHFDGELDHLDVRLTPCLFVPENRPAMVVISARAEGGWLVYDSADESEHAILPGSGLHGEMYLFQMDGSRYSNLQSAGWIYSIFWGFKQHIFWIFLLTVMTTLLALATPMFIMLSYDRVIPTGNVVMGAMLVIGVLLAIGLDWALRMLKSKLLSHVGGRVEYIFGNAVFQRIINLPTTAIDGASISRQVGRVKNLESLRDYFLGPMLTLLFELPSNLLLLGIVLWVSPWIALVVLCSVIGFVLLKFLSDRFDEQSFQRVSTRGNSRWEFLNETLTNMKIIRATGAYLHWTNRYRELSGKVALATYKDAQLHARVNGCAQVLSTLTGLVSLGVAAYLTIQGHLTTGQMIASMMVVWRITGPMQNVFFAVNSYAHMRNNFNQVERLMRLSGEHDGGARQSLRPNVQGNLTFSRVSFRYNNEADPALLGLTFSLQAGQLAVVSGSNGSGKSSLMKLILRLYLPQAGTIRIDDVDIRQLRAADLRARISFMPQTCDVFFGTISQNMRMAYPSATDDELLWAVSMAGLEEDVAALPKGLGTHISNTMMEQLPRGFLQRLSLARAMLKPAPIMLLDEPGTGMDSAGEDALVRCLNYLRGRATVIMVSHRPSHMHLADVVIHIEHGSVIAMGPYEKIKDQLQVAG